VALFNSCFVNYNCPEIGKGVVRVLSRNGVEMRMAGAACCGMPAIDAGDVPFAQSQARKNVEALYPLVREGLPIVVVNPSCSMMLRREYPQLLAPSGDLASGSERNTELYDKAVAVSEKTYDVCEYVFGLHREGRFDREFRSSPAGVAYHVPCHLKPQKIGLRSRDLMKLLPDCKVRVVNECCGHDGTWAMKLEHFDDSIKTGERAFDGLRKTDAEVWATDCPLAAIQIEQHAGRPALHPLQIIARAYREDGFPHKVEPHVEPQGDDAT
jgi:Fe-S oxidoreductase